MSSEDAEFRHSQVVVGGSSVHVVEAGDQGTAPFLFLHGWPESWRAWRSVMSLASQGVRAIAVDLPGIGQSTGAATDGSKRQLAAVVDQLVTVMGLRRLTLVGQDVGGMVVYSGLRGAFDDLELTAGFNWYRTFAKDAVENKEAAGRQGVTTPVLYLRGEQESGQIGAYVEGFRAAGLVRVDHGLVPAAGHFTQEEAPDDTWRLIAEFAGR